MNPHYNHNNPPTVRNDQKPLHLVENRGNQSFCGDQECEDEYITIVTSEPISTDLPLVSMIQNASDECLSQLKVLLGLEENRSLNGIPTYSGMLGEIIEDFFDNYELTTEAKGWNDDKRKKMLPIFLKGRALSSYKWGGKEKRKYEDLKKYLIEHHRPADAESYYREQLHNRMQGENEDVLTYSYGLLNLAARVEQYGGNETKPSDKMLMDMFVKGLQPCYKKLVKEHNFKAVTFEELCDRVRIFEEASQVERSTQVPDPRRRLEVMQPKVQDKRVDNKAQFDEVVNALNELPEKLMELIGIVGKRKFEQDVRARPIYAVEREYYQNESNSRYREDRECFNCERIGHVAKDCRFSKRIETNGMRDDSSWNHGRIRND